MKTCDAYLSSFKTGNRLIANASVDKQVHSHALETTIMIKIGAKFLVRIHTSDGEFDLFFSRKKSTSFTCMRSVPIRFYAIREELLVLKVT